jgi:hypothetical protein
VDFAQKTLSLGLPVLIGLLILAWYNWARFGSFSETGFSYALAGTNIHRHAGEVMSYRYVIQNFFNYFLGSFQIQDNFPFVHSNPGNTKAVLPFYKVPMLYGTNAVTGLFYVIPFALFSAVAVYGSISRKHWFMEKLDVESSLLRWLVFTLAGSSLLALAVLLVFFWAAMRYVADFLPMLLIVSVIGFCQMHTAVGNDRKERIVAVIGIFLAGFSIVIGTVLGFADSIVFFRDANPGLMGWLGALFD